MKILVCGDRNWTDKLLIKERLQPFALTHGDVTIIHGDANGADRLAGECAKELGYKVEVYPADWKTYGKAAGPIRNRQMLRQGEPELILAFHDNLRESKGTKDMLRVARQLGYSAKLYCHSWAVHNSESLL